MRAVVVEDQALFREFLVMMLADKMGIDVVGTASDGPTALEVLAATRPDLVILDILIPRLSGIRVARQFLDQRPDTRILALSAEMDPKTVYQVHRLNLLAFVDKNEASTEVLKEALERVCSRRRYYSESVRRVLHELRTDPAAFPKVLTRREQEVLSHIGGGLSDEEIGRILGLSPASVQSHRKNLFNKLSVHSTPELIRYAVDAGFWKPEFERMDLQDGYHLHE